jgi:hypothetical protein
MTDKLVLVSDRHKGHVRGGNQHAWLEVGDFIKVRHNAERFWCVVRDLDAQGRLVVEVNNNLIGEHDFSCGDLIAVSMELYDGMFVWVPA